MSEKLSFYHNPQEPGFWTGNSILTKNILLENKTVLEQVIPIGIEVQEGVLVMVLSTFEGNTTEPVDSFPGLKVVKGDSQNHPYETDDELLIEFTYLKIDKMELKTRRVRPAAIKFGIWGDTSKENAEKGGHRAMGESADYYLVAIDTQYDPARDSSKGLRQFPFWRIGVWGDPTQLAREYLPQPPPA